MAQIIRIKMMGKKVEVYLSENVLTQSTVKSLFLLPADAIFGLWYEVNGKTNGCQMNEAGTCFLLPNGWQNIEFFVESDKAPSRSAMPMDQAMDERRINPYYPISPPDPAPMAESFMKWMFFLEDQMGKSTVICVHPRFFVTFRHGTHSQFKLDDELTVYSAKEEVDEQIGVKVNVVKVNEALDFVLLKSDLDVVKKGPSIVQARESELFTLAGFGNEHQSLSYLPGEIHSIRGYYSALEGHGRRFGPFIVGTSRSSGGDSGGGIWGSRGLIGMNVACTTMPLKLHHFAIAEALRFKRAYIKELEDERIAKKVVSVPPKNIHDMVHFEGIGTGWLQEL